MKIVTARKEDLGLIRKISHETIKSVYPAYYPAGAVEFFLAHHSEEHIAADIADGKVWILYKSNAGLRGDEDTGIAGLCSG